MRPANPLPTLADRLVETLEELGVRAVFGIPGGVLEPFYDALARAERRGALTNVLVRHEAAAVSLAEGTVREGAPLGVCCATSGPGALNMLSAAASAHLERTPLLVITAQTALPKFGQGPLQDSSTDGIDTVAAFMLLSKYSSLVSHPQQLQPKLAKALRLALSPPMGVVHLSVPPDVFSATWSTPFELNIARPSPSPASEADMAEVTRRLHAAHSPLLLLGEDAISAQDEIRLLADCGLPVVATAGGHQWFKSEHPRFKGVHGFAGHPLATQAVRESDCVIALGLHFRDFCIGSEACLRTAKVISVADNPATLASAPPAALPVLANLGQFASALVSDQLRARSKTLDTLPRFSTPNAPEPVSGDTACPVRTLRHLASALPQDSSLYIDAGNAWSWAFHYLPLAAPLRRFNSSLGFGQMGWALATAIGAAFQMKQARRGGRALALTGDGSWLMSGLELTVAVEHQLPVVFLVLNDACLGMVKFGQRLTGAEPAGHHVPAVNFSAIAAACGARSVRVPTTAHARSLDWAGLFADAGPLVVEILVDPETAPPMAQRIAQLKTASSS